MFQDTMNIATQINSSEELGFFFKLYSDIHL